MSDRLCWLQHNCVRLLDETRNSGGSILFFDHSVRPILGTTPPGAGKDWRAIPLSKPGDIVRVQSPCDRQLLEWYRDVLRQASIEIGEVSTNDTARPAYGQLFDAFCLDGHVVPEKHPAITAIPWLNHKGKFLTWCRQNRWPIPQTQVADALMPLGSKRFPIVYKPSVMAGGHGVEVVPDHEVLQRVIGANAVEYVLQEYLADACFYGVQVETNGTGQVVSHHIAQQVIDGSAYVGASTTIDQRLADQIWQVVSECVAGVAKYGLPDFVIDVAVTTDADRILIMECNPRYGASTYPWKLAHRLFDQGAPFEYRYIPVVVTKPQDLRFGEQLFSADRQAGILPIDLSGVFPGSERREVGIVSFARSQEERLALLRIFQEHNGVPLSVCA